MSVVALVEPGSLLGQDLRESLDAESDLELRLLGVQEAGYGTLTEVSGDVALVQALSVDSLADVDLTILCGGSERQVRALSILPEAMPTIVAATDFDHPAGALRVSGVNDGGSSGTQLVVSPHPTVVLLSHLLFALSPHAPQRLSATLLLPASSHGDKGLEELFEQTRAILNFSGEVPQGVFGRQLAFNLLPGPEERELGPEVCEILGREVEISVKLLNSPVFHGLAASLLIEMSEATDSRQVAQSLRQSPFIESVETPDALGPIDVAGRKQILVGEPSQDGNRPEAVWLWAMMDNLTLGGATNVVGLAREILGRRDA